MNILLIFAVITICSINIVTTTEQMEKPSFRIVAPQVICKDKKDSEIELPKQITISMQTVGGLRLSYRVEIFFEVLGGFRGQQHSLKLWNSIRSLENKINHKDRDVISEKNQINVNNTELTSGVYYIFKITGVDANMVESDPQNYTVTFSDGSIKRTNPDGSIIPDDLSFILLAAQNTFANIEYSAEAKVSFCEPRYDYLYKWQIKELADDEQPKWLQIPGNILRIPPKSLHSGGQYHITVSLLQSNDSSVIIYQSLKMKVLERGFSLNVFPDFASIGIGQETNLNLQFQYFDNTLLTPEFLWNCMSLEASPEACKTFEASSSFVQPVEFYSKGKYQIEASVTVENTTKSAAATIQVDPDIIARVQFKGSTFQDIPSGHGFKLESVIDDLIPNCEARWTVVNATDYEYFDEALFPGGIGNITVLDMEGNFLSELVDYANTTYSRDISLTVPDANAALNWHGLEPNARYKFRLITMCPAPISFDESNGSNQTVVVSNNDERITSFVDVTVTTNQPPIGRILEVEPSDGVALKTIFKFSTGVAMDEADDFPLKYKFQFRIDDRVIVDVGEYYENMVTTARLPYSSKPIETMYEVCDSRQACSVVTGPTVTVSPYQLSEAEFVDIVEQIRASMHRMEYSYALNLALSAGISFQNIPDTERFQKIESITKELIAQEIKRMQENTVDLYLPKDIRLNFVRMAQRTISLFSNTDEIVQNLVQLLGMSTTTTTGKSMKRVKRSNVVAVVADEDEEEANIDDHLKLLEYLVKSNNETVSRIAKRNLTKSIHSFMLKTCKYGAFKSQVFDHTPVRFELRHTNAKQLSHNNFSVPTDTKVLWPAVVSFNNMLLENTNGPTAAYCVGKVRYPSDYLTGTNGSNDIYDLRIIKLGSTPAHEKHFLQLTDLTGLFSFDLYIPFYSADLKDVVECQIWSESDGKWMSNLCKRESVVTHYIKCKCNQIGYFRIGTREDIQNESVVVENVLTEATTTVEQNANIEATTVKLTDWSTTTEHVTVSLSPQIVPPSEIVMPEFNESTLMPETVVTNDPSISTVSPILQTIATIIGLTNLTSTSEAIATATSSGTGYILAVIFVLSVIIGAIILFVYNRRTTRRTSEQQITFFNTETRQSTPNIKYGRFQDEQTMRGENTLFTVRTQGSSTDSTTTTTRH